MNIIGQTNYFIESFEKTFNDESLHGDFLVKPTRDLYNWTITSWQDKDSNILIRIGKAIAGSIATLVTATLLCWEGMIVKALSSSTEDPQLSSATEPSCKQISLTPQDIVQINKRGEFKLLPLPQKALSGSKPGTQTEECYTPSNLNIFSFSKYCLLHSLPSAHSRPNLEKMQLPQITSEKFLNMDHLKHFTALTWEYKNAPEKMYRMQNLVTLIYDPTPFIKNYNWTESYFKNYAFRDATMDFIDVRDNQVPLKAGYYGANFALSQCKIIGYIKD